MSASQVPDFNFTEMSEADVREQVITPILGLLGYCSGTTNTILREQTIKLRYPHLFLGRKKPGRDPVLKGRPDYICEARGVTRWVIEAKSAAESIGIADIEQAHSYANHVEIAAPFFVLTNGHEWLVFESYRGPALRPLLRLTHNELREQFYVLLNLLSPSALARRYPVQILDLGRPLASGLGSNAEIISGFTRYDGLNSFIERPDGALIELPGVNALIGYEVAIVGGRCFRSEKLGIVADVRMHHPRVEMRQFAELLGKEGFRYVTREAAVSENAERPSIFEFTGECVVPAGTAMYDIVTWKPISNPSPVRVVAYAEATGYVDGSRFQGAYSSRMMMEMRVLGTLRLIWMFTRGSYIIDFRAA